MVEKDLIEIEVLSEPKQEQGQEQPKAPSANIVRWLKNKYIVTSRSSARMSLADHGEDNKIKKICFGPVEGPTTQYIRAEDCLELAEFFKHLAATIK